MSEMTWTRMLIGGSLPLEGKVGDMVEAILNDFYDHDLGGRDNIHDLIETCIETKQPIAINGNVNYAQADIVCAFCEDHGLTYLMSWESCPGNFDAGCKLVGPNLYLESLANAEGEPVLELQYLKTRAANGHTLADIIAEFGDIDEDKVPPLSWVEAAAAVAP